MIARVPCNGCTACCRDDTIVLHPECGDDPAQYRTRSALNPLTGEPCLALQQGPDGGCVYLGAGGCTIHDRAPAVCRGFDCRRIAATLGRQERRRLVRLGVLPRAVLQAGFDRLATLEPADR